MGAPLIEIITVHGTFAQDENRSDSGHKWWQSGSDFLIRLQSFIVDDIVVTPFHWSGANSERKRRLAAKQLSRAILKCEEPPVVLAHSHGGSVSILALARLVNRIGGRQTNSVRAVINIGMPFIWFRHNWNFVSRFNLVGRTFLVTSLLFFIEAIRSGFRYPSVSDGSLVEQVGSVAHAVLWNVQSITALTIFAILGLSAIPSWRRSASLRKGLIKKTYGQFVTNLSHRQDEAIGALTAGAQFRPKLLTFRGIFVATFSAVSALVLLIEFAAALLPTDVIVDDSWTLSAFDEIEKQRTENVFSIQTGPNGAGLKFEETGRATLSDHLVGRTYELAQDLVPIPFQKVSEQFQLGATDAVSAQIDPSLLPRLSSMLSDTTFYVAEDEQEEFLSALFDAIVYYANRKSEEDFDENSPTLPETSEPQISKHNFAEIEDFFYDYELGATNDDLHSVEFPPTLVVRSAPHAPYRSRLRAGTRFVGTPGFDQDAFRCLEYDLPNKDRCSSLREILDGGKKRSLEWILKDFRTLQTDFALAVPIIARRDETATWHRNGWAQLSRRPAWTRVYDALVFAATIALVLSLILTPLLSRFLVLTLRNSAYGNDVSGEHIFGVARDDDFAAFPTASLPEEVEEEMQRQSIEDASSAIDRIRRLVFSEMIDSKKPNDPVTFAMKFEKSELIHNAYFHSDMFIRYLVAILVVRYGLPLSELGREDAMILHFIDSVEKA